jgi:hypothetical protein
MCRTRCSTPRRTHDDARRVFTISFPATYTVTTPVTSVPAHDDLDNTLASVRDLALQLLRRELSAVERETLAYPDDASLWRIVPGIGNAGGSLALHLAGNIRHFIGAVLGGSGYVRNRDAEFMARDGHGAGERRDDVAAEIRDALDQLTRTMQALPPSQLLAPYPVAIGNGVVLRTDAMLLHLASHAAYHLGQIDYHRRMVTGDGTTVGTLALGALSASEAARG